MNPLKLLTTPEYLFRPTQILRRLQRAFARPEPKEFEMVQMPWGFCLRVRPSEIIGSHIWWYGMFELIVAETIWRLLDEGETGLDIGANLGQMASLMQHRAGSRGCVHAFEPHPEIFAELKHNVTELAGQRHGAKVVLHNVALGEHPGRAWLDCGPHWNANRGLAKVVAERDANSQGVEVELKSLDEVLAGHPTCPSGAGRKKEPSIGVCKIDVEGHELAVVKGAAATLSLRAIRDIVFEDFTPFPGEVPQYLAQFGYTIYSLHRHVLRPGLTEPSLGENFNDSEESVNFLATLDSNRALGRFRRSGWMVLRRTLPQACSIS